MKATTMLLLALAAFLIAAGPAHTAPAKAPPPAPGEGVKDWIQLPAGEWLAGEIKFMRNESIEFKSEKLDVQTLDWADIVQVRSPRALTYVLTDHRVAVGTATLKDSVLRVVEGGVAREFSRADLLAILKGEGSERDRWSGNIDAGLSASSGNTDQADGNFQGLVRREETVTRLELRYAGNFGQLNGVENANNHIGSAKVDRFLSRQLFITPLAVQLYSDRFQNIELRTSVIAGVGYYFVRRGDLEWFVLAGAGYLSTRSRSVAAGENSEKRSASLTPGTSVEWDIVKDLTLDVAYNTIVEVPDVENWSHHFVVALKVENFKIVELRTSATWDRTANPEPRADGSVPKKDDLRTTVGLGIEF
ncbi:MAG: DUF481 domain-containing protein [Candidatus Eisenbacteria bacterium]